MNFLSFFRFFLFIIFIFLFSVSSFAKANFNEIVLQLSKEAEQKGKTAENVELINEIEKQNPLLVVVDIDLSGKPDPSLIKVFRRYRSNIVLALLGLSLPFWALCILIFIWGTGAGTTMTMGRTIVQLAAPDSHRARVLALYQLGFSGGAPVGSFCMGYLVGTMGIHSATLAPALIVTLILAGLVRFSPIWAYRDEERSL